MLQSGWRPCELRPSLNLHSFISSCLEYCNSIFTCLNQKAIAQLQTAELTVAARILATVQRRSLSPVFTVSDYVLGHVLRLSKVFLTPVLPTSWHFKSPRRSSGASLKHKGAEHLQPEPLGVDWVSKFSEKSLKYTFIEEPLLIYLSTNFLEDFIVFNFNCRFDSSNKHSCLLYFSNFFYDFLVFYFHFWCTSAFVTALCSLDFTSQDLYHGLVWLRNKGWWDCWNKWSWIVSLDGRVRRLYGA